MELEYLFFAGMGAFATHGISAWYLSCQLDRDEQLHRELFITRYGALSRKHYMLRAKFFLPWAKAPESICDYYLPVRGAYQIARWSGIAFPSLMLAFFAAAVIQAGR